MNKTPSIYPSMFLLNLPYTCKILSSREWQGSTVINVQMDPPVLNRENVEIREGGLWFDPTKYSDGGTIDQAKMDQEFMFKSLTEQLPEGQVFQATREGKPWAWKIVAGFGEVGQTGGGTAVESPSTSQPTQTPQAAVQAVQARLDPSTAMRDITSLLWDCWTYTGSENFGQLADDDRIKIFATLFIGAQKEGLVRDWERRRELEWLLPTKPEAEGDLDF